MADERNERGLRGRDLLGLGGVLVGGVVGGMLAGLGVDNAADSSPTGVLVGIGLGAVLAIGFCVVRVRSVLGG